MTVSTYTGLPKSSVEGDNGIYILASAQGRLFDHLKDGTWDFEGDNKAVQLMMRVSDILKAEIALKNYIFCLDPDALTKALRE